jgi:ribosome biogenesis GTPase
MLDSTTLERLRGIGLAAPLISRLPDFNAYPDTSPPNVLRVVELQRDALTLHDGEHEQPARALPALLASLAERDDALAVGDWVLAERNAHGQWWAHERVPPLNQITRRLHDGRDKATRTVIVANVDTALLVMGLDQDYNPRRLERYLALVRLAGVAPLVVLTKADLCHEPGLREAREREVQAILPPGAAVLSVDATRADAALALAPWMPAGHTLVLLGASGTGKSTLTNSLLGASVQPTGGNRSGDGRGRHTTTARSLHRSASGACIIDTPGLRTLRLDTDAGDVRSVFDDIAQLATQCRYRNCRHQGEPGCAVAQAVPAPRLKNFHKLLREAGRDAQSALQRKEQVQAWKIRSRAARERARDKR